MAVQGNDPAHAEQLNLPTHPPQRPGVEHLPRVLSRHAPRLAGRRGVLSSLLRLLLLLRGRLRCMLRSWRWRVCRHGGAFG